MMTIFTVEKFSVRRKYKFKRTPMRRLLTITLLLASICGSAQTDGVEQKVDSYLAEKMEQFKIPGIPLVVLKNNLILNDRPFAF
jgi:hypothetical protein